MNLEKQKQIKELLSIYRPTKNQNLQDAYFLGMCQAMLTDEQGDTMISYLELWIAEGK